MSSEQAVHLVTNPQPSLKKANLLSDQKNPPPLHFLPLSDTGRNHSETGGKIPEYPIAPIYTSEKQAREAASTGIYPSSF